MTRIIKKIKFETSIYSVLETKNYLYVGGSDWDRRKIKYTKEIAEKSKGILWIFKKYKKNYNLIKKLIFPSMVYSIIKVAEDKILVGCKSSLETLTLISEDGKIISQKDDFLGQGIYNLEFDEKRNEILAATRKGYLIWFNSQTLKIIKKISLSKKERLWSLKLNKKLNLVYIGDYAGVFYIIDLNSKKLLKKINFKKEFYKKDPRVQDGFGPSLWGLEIKQKKIILANRWGGIFFIKNNKVIDDIHTQESFTCMNILKKNNFLLGTRDGKIILFDIGNKSLKVIFKSKKFFQKENAIYGMDNFKDAVWICFADGDLIKIK